MVELFILPHENIARMWCAVETGEELGSGVPCKVRLEIIIIIESGKHGVQGR